MNDNVIPFKEPDPKCSFCGATKSQSQKFIAGPNGKNICGVCIKHAKKRLEDTKDE